MCSLLPSPLSRGLRDKHNLRCASVVGKGVGWSGCCAQVPRGLHSPLPFPYPISWLLTRIGLPFQLVTPSSRIRRGGRKGKKSYLVPGSTPSTLHHKLTIFPFSYRWGKWGLDRLLLKFARFLRPTKSWGRERYQGLNLSESRDTWGIGTMASCSQNEGLRSLQVDSCIQAQCESWAEL